MTFLSRMLGFVRDMVVANFFGVSEGVDAFYVAFKIPNFMRGLFAEGSFSQAFVPVLSEYRQQQSFDEVRVFISHLFATLTLILIAITLFCMLAAPYVVDLFAPGFKPDTPRFTLAVSMLRITFPYLLFISLTAFFGSILNAYQRFGLPAFTPVLLNIAMIGAAYWLAPCFNPPVIGLAWGVFIGGVMQWLMLMPLLYRLKLLPKPHLNFHHAGVRKVLCLMLPALFGASVVQISLLFNTIFASFLAVGSVSWLYYSDRLAYFPLGVFGVALSTVILPHLSAKHSNQEHDGFAAALGWGIRCNLLIGVPAALALFLLAKPLITCLFQYGKFTASDVLMTSKSVMAYSLGLPAFMLIKVLSSAFYAKQNIKTPVRIAATSVIFNILLNAALFIPLEHAGLALATSLAAWLNAGLLFYWLCRAQIYRPQSKPRQFVWQLLFANMVLCLACYIASPPVTVWLDWHWQTRLAHLSILLLSTALLYFSALWLVGMRWKNMVAISNA